MEITLPDQPERSAALDLTYSYIVQAPAGSGKTELLIQRYLALLAQVPAMPEEVLAITFTRKAALEMRHRVTQALALGAQSEPIEAHKKTTWRLARAVLERDQRAEWRLSQNAHRLRILTIDALCALLVRQAPLRSMLSDQMDIAEDDDLYIQAVHDLLNTLGDETPWTDALKHLLLHLDNNYSQLENLLVDLLKKRDQWLPHLGLGKQNTEQLRTVLEKNLARVVMEGVQKWDAAIPVECRAELATLANFAGKQVMAGSATSACGKHCTLPEPTRKNLAYWRGLNQLLLTQSGTLRKMLTVRDGFPTAPKQPEKSYFQEMKKRMLGLLAEFSQHPNLIMQIENFSHFPPTHYAEAQWETLTHILTVLPILVAHLNIVFQQKRQVDYVEIALKALSALGEEDAPSDLILNLDYKIQHILVDEFQDTSFTQFHLLKKLTAGWQAQDGRTLFLVGDPMQSIYRFRKAEVGLFLRAAEQGIGSVQLIPLVLSANFRCQKNVMDWINPVFSQIFPQASDIVAGAIPFSPSWATHQTQNPLPAVTYYCGEDKAGKAEAFGIKEIITRLQTESPEHKIAILVRGRRHLVQIIPLLKAFNIPFNASEITALISSSVIQDLLALCRALLYLTDRTAWLAILRAPWCGLQLADLTCVAEASPIIWESLKKCDSLALSADGKQRLSYMVPLLTEALANRHHESVASFIEKAWRSLGGHLTLSVDHLAQVETFFIFLAASDEGGDIQDRVKFSAKLERLFCHAKEGHPHAVEVMTIHKAKGLEFDAVILPGLQYTTVYDSHALLLWMERPREGEGEDLIMAPLKNAETEEHDPIYHYLRYMENQKAKNELVRLLYVAATRAKRNLFLTWTRVVESEAESVTAEKVYAPPAGSFLSLLYPCIAQDKIVQLKLPQQAVQQSAKRYQRFATLTQNSVAQPLMQTALSLTSTRGTDLFETRMQRNVGIVVHRIFMQQCLAPVASFTLDNMSQQQSLWRTVLQGLGTPPALLEKSVGLIQHILSKTLQDKTGLWLLSTHQHSSVNHAVALTRRGRVEQLVIDRLFRDESGVTWLVLFKMGEKATDSSNFFRGLEECAKVFFAPGQGQVKLGVYFPFETAFFEKVVEV